MILRKGLRIRLESNGDPAPHHFVSDGPPFRWGVNDRKLGDLMTDDAAVAATWRRFRECAVVPEAGATIVELTRNASGAEVAVLLCRNGCRVGYLVEQLMMGWEHEPEAAIEVGQGRSRELAAGQ